MPVKLKWPWLGIAIPCFLISFLAYTAHWFILRHYLSLKEQIWFQISTTFIWISYYLAIYTNPGKPSPKYTPSSTQWKTFCKKCNLYKPERAHHCKTCNQCVLMMDHHCPWTMNCVGYFNFPHFMRFLFWVVATTAFLSFHLTKRICYLWQNRNLPEYLFKRSEIISMVCVFPLNLFVLLTISILFIRCFFSQIVSGKTQIESWELDRLTSLYYSKRLIALLVENFNKMHPDDIIQQNSIKVQKLIKSRSRFENIVNFPYDLDICKNAYIVLGSPIQWLWFFGKPTGDGMSFEKNEFSQYEDNGTLEDKLLSIPWPPDGGKHKLDVNDSENVIETSIKDGERVIKKRTLNNNKQTTREKWSNEWGENLSDFGVDLEMDKYNSD